MKSPFKFLDAYTRQDKALFFGRSQETDALHEMATKNRLILIYGASGTGKTSLVQCGLAARFDATDWYPLFVRRQSDLNQSIRQAFQQALGNIPYENPNQAIEEIYMEYLRPVYLIFDQLEELVILGSPEEQATFAHTIAQIAEAQQPCRIIFIIREEYLAHLYAFEKIIPRLFTRRLRVEPLGRNEVREVIVNSCHQFNIHFESPEHNPEQIIDNLSAGKSGIALPYLQVYLDMLYQQDFLDTYGRERKDNELPPLEFSTNEIAAFGAIENVLDRFLDEQLLQIQLLLKSRFNQPTQHSVVQILDAFVSEEGTKRPIPFDTKGDQLLVDRSYFSGIADVSDEALSLCLQSMESSRLLRDNDGVFELAHDSLAAIIDQRRSDEQRRLNLVRRRLKNAYAEYQASGQWLSRGQLAGIEEVLPELQGELDQNIKRFIEQSYQAVEAQEQAELREERQKRKKARRIAVVGLLLAALTSMAALAAWWQYQEANRAKIKIAQAAFETQLKSAEVLKVQGEYEAALTELHQALTWTPLLEASEGQKVQTLIEQWTQVKAYMNMGQKIAAEEDLLGAISYYSRADSISTDANIKNIIVETTRQKDELFLRYTQRGDAMAINNKRAAAIESYQKALKLRPDDVVVQGKLARLLGE
ncbi:MAG TPA: hypothetical protein PKA00_09210 [Saprospiraceae bacterium]|nr:hypothetical protein [Saprospiraceae bacterium]HMQ83075.1 hypothetical protein [Saprospiraceae bacterium]